MRICIVGGGDNLHIKKLRVWSGDHLISPADIRHSAASSVYDDQHGNPMRVFGDVGGDWSAFCSKNTKEGRPR